jgi:hypothetical protein
MRFFAFIMAFLVLALSVMPCADEINAVNEDQAKTSIVQAGHSESANHQDDCSPFCQCSCCAGFVLNQSVTALAKIPLLSGNPQASFIPSPLFSIALPIWQPPQLV